MIETLTLQHHPKEGGYFSQTYASEITLAGSDRKLMTVIYYLLSDDSPVGYMHKNRSDIVHFYHGGAPIKYWLITPTGELSVYLLGPDIANGERPQLVVKGGDWKVTQLCLDKTRPNDADPLDYGLISEAVAPGFDYRDNEIATLDTIKRLFPHLVGQLAPYIVN